MNKELQEAEFAPEYTPAERVRLIAIIVAVALALAAASKYWLIPALRAFADNAHCYEVAGVQGATLLFYGTMFGFPLLAAILTGAMFGWRGYKTLRDGQFPPLGEKVMQRTPVRRGRQARLIGWLHQLAFLPLLALACWGYVQAGYMASAPLAQAHACGMPARAEHNEGVIDLPSQRK